MGGTAQLKVALIDGPVAIDHPDLSGQNIQQVTGEHAAVCSTASSIACIHGTFVAGILSAKRGSVWGE